MQPSGFSSFSAPFILRPIGTALLAAGLFLLGAVAYVNLPVASLPTVDFPTLRVQASRPGADPETMAATIAAPLERRLGEIAGVTELTSVSSQGTTGISIQFDLSRNIDGAARDVQAALNAATADLPSDLPQVPTFRKLNPSAAPVLILAMTSKVLAPTALYDVADTVIAQRMSQVDGVAQVQVSGAEQPAVRVRVNPTLLQSMGLSMEDVRSAIDATNNLSPVGAVEADKQQITLSTNDQLRKPEDYGALVIKTINGDVVRLSSVASVEQGSRNTRSAAMFDHQPAVLLIISKQPDANVIDTVDRVKALLPDLQRWIPAGIDISVLSDRTTTIRASVADMQLTLTISIALVMLVVFVFLRRLTPTAAAGITVPLSLAGTCTVMWALGYSVNNLTLMAFAIAVGFVVDDAIVMIENIYRNLERGLTPMAAALEGARQIGFTVLSISISLIAAFIPVLFMSGIVGRLLREFSVTLAAAIAVSVVVSLSVTPMICAHFLKPESNARPSLFDRVVEGDPQRPGEGICAHAHGGAAPPGRHAVYPPVRDRAHDASLRHHAQGSFPRRRHRPHHGQHRGSGRRLLRGDGQVAEPGAGHHPEGPRRQSRRLVRRSFGFQRLREPRPDVRRPQVAQRAQRQNDHAGDQPDAQRAGRSARHRRAPRRLTRYPRRCAAGQLPVPVHALGPRHRRALRVGAEDPRAHEAHSRAGRRIERPPGRRTPARRQDRSRRRRTARGGHRCHRQRAQQRLLAAPDLHHLRRAQPIQSHPRGRPAAAARPVRSRPRLRAGTERRAGSAAERHQDDEGYSPPRRQPPGALPCRHHFLRYRRPATRSTTP